MRDARAVMHAGIYLHGKRLKANVKKYFIEKYIWYLYKTAPRSDDLAISPDGRHKMLGDVSVVVGIDTTEHLLGWTPSV